LLRETVILNKQIWGSLSDSLKKQSELARKNHGKAAATNASQNGY